MPKLIKPTGLEKRVKQISDFIKNHKEFAFKSPTSSYNYAVGDTFSLSVDSSRNLTNNHMGATIIDGILQAGLNYKNVVKPRVDKFKNEYRNLRTTSQFYNLIQEKDLSELINMKGQKIDRILALTRFLKNEKIETEDDFYEWLKNSDNVLALSNLKGIKDKTIDYFKILTGYKDVVAIDTHLINFIKLCCEKINDISYVFAREVLIRSAKELKIEPATLDHSIWYYMSNKK